MYRSFMVIPLTVFIPTVPAKKRITPFAGKMFTPAVPPYFGATIGTFPSELLQKLLIFCRVTVRDFFCHSLLHRYEILESLHQSLKKVIENFTKSRKLKCTCFL